VTALSRHAIQEPLGVYLSAVETWRLIWGDNIKMDFLEFGLGGRDWINLAQDRAI
jgi:hypothetical protein